MALSTLLCLQKGALEFKFTVPQMACTLSYNIATRGSFLRTASLISIQSPYSCATC